MLHASSCRALRRARTGSLARLLLAAALLGAGWPSAASAACAFPPAGDADCDGLLDASDPCPADTLNRCLTSVATCAAAPPGTQDCTASQALRLNFGNVGHKTDCNGDAWLDDTGPGKNGTGTVGGAPITAAFGCTSADTAAIVASENAAGVLTRSYPVAVGSYLVNLLFAETNAPTCVSGSRTFDISFEGARVYGGPGARDGFDPYAASLAQNAGGDPAHADACGGLVVRSALVDVTDGALDLALVEDDTGFGDNNAAVKAIEVRVVALPCAPGDDDDGDGVCDAADNCPAAFNPGQEDTQDGDGAGDACDNCPSAPNPSQSDADHDTQGDACDPCPGDGLDDFDGDGVCAGGGFAAPMTGDGDVCPGDPDPAQHDGDGDGRGDACEICDAAVGAAEDACLGTGTWASRAANALERSEAGLVEVDGLLYLIGGEQSGTEKSVEIYDPAADAWSTGPDLPAGRDHIQPVVVGRKIYLIGGLLSFPGPSVDTVFVLDTEDLSAGWQQKRSMPTSRGAQGCAADGVRIFCAGGLSSTAADMAVDAFEVYNTVSDEWATLPDMPRVRDHFWAQIVDGKFYAIGGRDTLRSATYTHNDVYDIETGTWSSGAPLPTARGGYGSTVIEGRILIVGGEGDGPVSGTFPNVDEYDPVRDTWRALAPLPTSRHSVAVAVSDARGGVPRLYAISGGVREGGSKSNVNEELAYQECTGAGAACDDGDFCTVDFCEAGRCEHASNVCCDDRVWIAAASDPTAVFSGAMTTGTAYASGDDLDPDADSLNATLVFPDSSSNGSGSNPDKVTYEVTLPGDGDWYAWGRFYYPGEPGSNDANSFFLRLDDGPALRFGNKRDQFQRWHWDGDGAIETGAPVPLALGFAAAGPHVLTVTKREVVPIPPRLDVLFLTRDSLEVPTDAAARAAADCCATDADCDDANPCTDEICDGSACLRANSSGACDDGLFCNGTDMCSGGSCSLHAGSPCGGAGECAPTCDEADDACIARTGLPCTDDLDPCTDDVCDALGACAHAPNSAPCDDGSFCNGADTCAAGSCSLHAGDPCAGGPACADTCDESADSCFEAAGSSCDDGSACTAADQCDGAGACAGEPIDCSADADACNAAECDAQTGTCAKTPHPDGTACDDGRFCTESDACASGACVGEPRACGDGVTCTTDGCDEAAGACTNVPSDAACDDGVRCNGVETCDAATGCVSTPPPDCSQLDSVCGTGVCDEASGDCAVDAANEGQACDDDDPCTQTDACAAGSCTGARVANVSNGRIRVRMNVNGGGDRFNFTALAAVTALEPPTLGGAELALLRDDGALAYAVFVPASAFSDPNGKGTTFVFKDPAGTVADGLTFLRLQARPRMGAWRARGKLRDGDLSALSGTTAITLSLGVGGGGDATCIGAANAACKAKPAAVSCQFP